MSRYNNKNLDFSQYHYDTQLIRSGSFRTNFGETSEAIFLNSGFCYDSAEIAESRFNGVDPGFVYSRYVNPSLKMLEDRLATIENAESALVVASGMAAVFASIMCQIKSGDHLIASRVLFGSCYYIFSKILPNYGIEVSFVDGTNPDDWKQAFKSNTKIVFLETPANPTLEVIDIAFVADLCLKHKAKLIVDNILASSFCQKPLDLGADIVVYSTTKHLDGQGRSLGGAVLAKKDFIQNILLPFHRHTGPALSPFNAWLILKSLETYNMRMQKHCQNAMQIATFLDNHPKIKRVFYPHLPSHPQHNIAKKQMFYGGSMIAFEVIGNKSSCFSFLNNLKLIDISNNLGDAKSLITHPSTTTHSNMSIPEQQNIGISSNMCRLSVGLEHYCDLISDIDNSLNLLPYA
jgi:O-succinylhomoserine sulfhydrylase